MPYYEFTGDPNDPKDATTANNYMGLRFTRGKPVKVDDKDIAAKLEGNAHFTKVDWRNAKKSDGNHG